jgi:organic hydroperoxide reductase OsmC/OhrA
MAIRTAEAEWNGNLAQGSGQIRLGSGAYEGPYNFRSRMGDGKGANPEELLGAAHAGCFSMELVLELTKAGFPVQRIHTTAKFISKSGRANGPFAGSISKRKHGSRILRREPSKSTRRAPRRTVQCREPCRASTSIYTPNCSK